MRMQLGLAILLLTARLDAGELVVIVTGAAPGKGDVGCALYQATDGFPMQPEKALATLWQKAAETVECRFPNVPAGPAAVAVSVDWNGNRKTDKNFLGIPTEPWGVSNNVRPNLRAPRFAEAVFQMPNDAYRIVVKVAK